MLVPLLGATEWPVPVGGGTLVTLAPPAPLLSLSIGAFAGELGGDGDDVAGGKMTIVVVEPLGKVEVKVWAGVFVGAVTTTIVVVDPLGRVEVKVHELGELPEEPEKPNEFSATSGALVGAGAFCDPAEPTDGRIVIKIVSTAGQTSPERRVVEEPMVPTPACCDPSRLVTVAFDTLT